MQTVRQSQQEEIKEESIPESYKNCKNCTTGTVEGKSISHQEPREALTGSSRKTNTDLDKKYEESVPRRRNQPLKVKLDNTRIDNGAVHTFARTDATGVSVARAGKDVSGRTGMPHLQRQRKQADIKNKRSHTDSSTVVQKPQVKDVGSQTMVGSLSHRIASGTTLGPLGPKLKEEVIAVAKKEHAEADQEQPRDLVEGTEWKKVLHTYS